MQSFICANLGHIRYACVANEQVLVNNSIEAQRKIGIKHRGFKITNLDRYRDPKYKMHVLFTAKKTRNRQ